MYIVAFNNQLIPVCLCHQAV